MPWYSRSIAERCDELQSGAQWEPHDLNIPPKNLRAPISSSILTFTSTVSSDPGGTPSACGISQTSHILLVCSEDL